MPGLGGGMDPRQMAMMMKRLGIDVRDLAGVEEVVVRTTDKEYTFTRPSVSVMKAQGVETWQVSGSAVARPRAGAPAPAAAPRPGGAGAASPAVPAAPPAVPTTASGPAAARSIPEEDVRMVVEATGASPEKARKALEATGGDLAEAIVQLGGG